MRIGFGNDIHRLIYGRKLILSGVNVPSQFGELAHSDGDVVYHAVSDAILGALALGDIGKYFPDSDTSTLDMDSSIIVKKVVQMMKDKKMVIGNVDVTITLEQPKLKNFISEMRHNLAYLLNTSLENVSIKAGTNEGLDALGANIAVKAECVVLLKEEE